ncbi:MAG: hypothetical protein AAF664_21085 [Planctomycetota bacterium]
MIQASDRYVAKCLSENLSRNSLSSGIDEYRGLATKQLTGIWIGSRREIRDWI